MGRSQTAAGTPAPLSKERVLQTAVALAAREGIES
ncbi:MAG: hypothetical protein QOI64_2672, partial [Solirubrobacteraceae bacterium]|nr:hypothetical protein [Solirubrobacteraceae bacterium]